MPKLYAQINVKLSIEEYERFERIARDLKLSKPQALIHLMDKAEAPTTTE